MNRKQKKAKRLRATQHTKYKPLYTEAVQSIKVQQVLDQQEPEWFEPDEQDEPSKSTAKWVFCIVLICMLIMLWMFKVNT